VCKSYYLQTLYISQRRIEWFHRKSDENRSYEDCRGNGTKKKISVADEDFIRNHINSFTTIPSHYCRATTSKSYLEAGLSLTQMYYL
jgi:hypothetical protein